MLKKLFLSLSLFFLLSNESDYLIAQNSTNRQNLIDKITLSSFTNACNIVVNAGPDITICAGVGKQINGLVTGNFTSISWDPTDGLSNPSIQNPIANPTMTTTYTLTAKGTSANLFMNGGFENGSIAPSTSSYTLYTNINTFAMSTGGYMVLSVPQIAAQFGCNPPIGAFTMAVTPLGPSVNFLCQTIPVTSNTMYKIKFKCFGIPYILGAPPAVGCSINGNLIGTLDVASGLCVESDADFTWNSGASTSANICFANYGGTGLFSMFSIDDIEFRECCEEKDQVKVTVYDLLADIAMPEDISCNNSPLTLDGSGSSSGPLITYDWTTIDGKIESGDKTNKVKISSPGTYKLKVMGEFGCSKEVSVKVSGNTIPPDVTTSNTDITCTNLAMIDAKSKNTLVSYDWSGPNGYGSTKATNFNISEPGDYIVTVTDDYGCKTIKKVIVKDNRTEVFLDLKGDTIQCGEDSVKLIASSVSPKPSFIWKYKGNQISNVSSVFAKDTGWYYITVKDSLGCSKTDSFKVLSFQTQVPTQINASQITCKNSTAQLKLISDTSGTVSWKGPNGYTSNLKQPFVKDAGWYYLNITTKGGCVGKDSIFISIDTSIPNVFISMSDTITCKKSQVSLLGGSMTSNSIITWNGPNGILGNNMNYMVSDSGDYLLIVEGVNGCLNSARVKIYKDIDTPNLILNSDTITCNKRFVIPSISNDSSLTFSWIGPNGFNSNLWKPNLNTSGEYQVIAVSKNGCSRLGFLEIIADTLPPKYSVPMDTLTCLKTSITLGGSGDLDIVKYDWIGAGGFTSNLKNPMINKASNYFLKYTNSKGCSANLIVNIVEDINIPFVSISADDIVCNKQAFLKIINIDPGTNFTWTGPNGFMSNQPNPQVTNSGWYYITVIAKNGCVKNDSVQVIQKDKLPDLTTKDDTLTCLKTSIDLFADSQTPGVIYDWTGPNNFSSKIKNPKILIPGIYTIKITDLNGCELTKQVNILELNKPSNLQLTNIDSLTCKNNLTNINLNSSDQAKNITWSGPNNFTSTNKNISVNAGGWYVVVFLNELGCLTKDSILINDYRVLPIATVLDDSLNCKIKTIKLTLNTNEPKLTFTWSGPNGFTSNNQNPQISNGGTYIVTITNEFNCQLIKTVNITIDTIGPDLSLSADTLTCLRSSVPIKAGTTLQGFNINWIGPKGFQSMFPQAIVSNAGIYTCTLINPRTLCKTTKTIEVLEDTNRIRSSEFDTQDASCGQNNGSIGFSNIIGGSPTFQYSIDNGLTYFNKSVFDNLGPGKYDLKIKDKNGCEFSGTVNISNSSGVEIDLIPTVELNLNEQLVLNLNIKNSNNPIIFWDPSDQLSCNDCKNPTLTATKDQVINVIVKDEFGCIDTISVIVKVRSNENINVHVPNSISPNGDNINDYFFPISNVQDLSIQQMSIYSRWGERIFLKEHFTANNEREGWDGKYLGSTLNPGVYVYSISYYVGTEIRYLYGDVTIVH